MTEQTKATSKIKRALEILHPKQLIRIKQLELLTGRSRSTLYRLVSEQKLPAPISTGGRSRAWVAEDVLKYLESPATWRAPAAE